MKLDPHWRVMLNASNAQCWGLRSYWGILLRSCRSQGGCTHTKESGECRGCTIWFGRRDQEGLLGSKAMAIAGRVTFVV